MKSRNSNWMIVIGYLAIAFLLLFAVAYFQNQWRAFLGIPDKTIMIENENSELTSLLLSPENSPKEFSWYKTLLTQSGNATSEGNGKEAGTAILGGYYQNQRLMVLNTITKFENRQVSLGVFSDLPPAMYSSGTSNVSIARASDHQHQNCFYYTNSQARCSVEFATSDLIIFLEVTITTTTTDFSLAEDATNLLLNKIILSIQTHQ